MKRITPLVMSQEDFVKTLLESEKLTLEQYVAALIDNYFYDFQGKAPRSNVPWSFREDYDLVCLLLMQHSVRFISKVLQRSESAVNSRMLTVLGTSEWIKIICLSDSEKETLQNYFYNCMINNIPYEGRMNPMETVTLFHFLKYYGFDAEHTSY